jgi:hypothetical protein
MPLLYSSGCDFSQVFTEIQASGHSGHRVQGVPPRLPTAGQNDPQPGLTDRSKDVAPESTREDPDLVPKREVLQRELTLRSKG